MNFDRYKKKLTDIYARAIKRADPEVLVKDAVKLNDGKITINGLNYKTNKVKVVGFGKASCTMAAGVESALPPEMIEGMVVTKYGHLKPLSKIKSMEAGHPIPDLNSIRATNHITRLAREADAEDVVIFLVSGGGSALLETPRQGINLKDIQKLTDLLLKSGASINEINALRKHLSGVKGGWLAKTVFPASYVSLIISDVIGSDLTSIASGPTVPDTTTFEDCEEILKRYELYNRVPDSIFNLMQRGIKGEAEDTPKPGEPFFEKGEHKIVCDNEVICTFLIEEANRAGLNPVYIKTDKTQGSVEEFAEFLRTKIKPYTEQRRKNEIPPTLLIMGGELTVKIPPGATGMGGRNQHLALLFIRDCIPYFPGICALFASTDGTDGPTEASGGFSHGGLITTLDDKFAQLEEAVHNFDSYNFLRQHGELFITGPTGNNLNDVFMIFIP
ncbi:MAG: glycerate kinase [Vulcanimicrobiota bacterium]